MAEANVRPIQRAFAERYPVSSVGRSAGIVISATGVAPAGESEPVYQFMSDDRAWTVTLTPDSASLETTAYVDFMDFATRWHELLSVIIDVLDITRQDRIGLRYVNQMPVPVEATPDDLRRVVRAELVGAVGAHERTQRLVSSMHELRFAQDDGVCTLRHGVVPNENSERVYVLDLDFYDDRPRKLVLDQNLQQLAEFNHGAFELFRWAIPEELFASFDPEEI